MAIRKPKVFRRDGRSVDVHGDDSGLPNLSASDVAPGKLLETLNRVVDIINRSIGALTTGETAPIYFEDLDVTSSSMVPLRHGLGRRVRWSVVDWSSTATGDACVLERNLDPGVGTIGDDNTLALRSYCDGRVTVRVW